MCGINPLQQLNAQLVAMGFNFLAKLIEAELGGSYILE